MSKVIWIDTETTGLDAGVHGLVEIGFIIEVDGKEVERFAFTLNPFSYNRDVQINDKALEINGKSIEELKSFDNSNGCFNYFLMVLGKYIDKSDKKDKFIIKGYNVNFDIGFIKDWFIDNAYYNFDSWFSYKEIDVFALVKVLKDQNVFETENDKLLTLCEHFDIELDAHNALDDIVATKKLYNILVNKYIVGVSDGNESIQE